MRNVRTVRARKTEKAENREGWLCRGWLWVTWISTSQKIPSIVCRSVRISARMVSQHRQVLRERGQQGKVVQG